MTGEINLNHSEMYLETACSNMQASILIAEVGTSNLVVNIAQVLETAYNAQQSGDKEIYAAHSTNHQFSITVVQRITMENGSPELVTKTYYFDDPGLPTANMTGTKVGEFEDETNQTAKVYNTWVQSWQQSAEQEATEGYTQLNTLSQGQEGFVQFSSNTNQNAIFMIKLLQELLT